jgi:hypothetical protein
MDADIQTRAPWLHGHHSTVMISGNVGSSGNYRTYLDIVVAQLFELFQRRIFFEQSGIHTCRFVGSVGGVKNTLARHRLLLKSGKGVPAGSHSPRV